MLPSATGSGFHEMKSQMEQEGQEKNRTIAVLLPLFRKAQAVDEFEYVCTLLRVREQKGLD